MGWDALSEGLSVHLGIRESDADLRLQIDSTETRLREETAGRLARLSEDIARSAQRASAELLLVDGECEGQSGRSPMRSAGPPPERSAVCGVLRAIAQAKTESDEVAALLAVHDAVVVAQWAVGIHIDGWEAERAQQGHALTGFVPPERMGRFIRFAATRPIACIAVARMASLLGGADGRRARAKLWLAFGDAPLDIVEREWGAK
jgi:hypothetical protein